VRYIVGSFPGQVRYIVGSFPGQVRYIVGSFPGQVKDSNWYLLLLRLERDIKDKSKDWLAWNLDNVSNRSDRFPRGLLFQWTSTIKIQLSVLI
jgi:hypothetical protein